MITKTYVALKEFDFQGHQHYYIGDVFSTDLGVRGLINKGLIRELDPQCGEVIVDAPGTPDVDLAEVHEVEIYVPAASNFLDSDIPRATKADKFHDYEEYKPDAILKQSKYKALESVEEAKLNLRAAKNSRPTTKKEMDAKMTNLVEEVNDAVEKKPKIKGNRKTKKNK